MSEGKRVVVSADLGEFFRTEVISARSNLGLTLNEGTEYYLVNLLCEFARSDERRDKTHGDEPLAILYQRASDATVNEKVQLLKVLGDKALYVAGFFSEFIDTQPIDIDYYIAMGGTAYRNLSGVFHHKPRAEAFATLYGDLAVHFGELVDILNQVSERTREKKEGDSDLLKLYDRWVRTGSERLRKQLTEHGFLTVDGLPTDYLQ